MSGLVRFWPRNVAEDIGASLRYIRQQIHTGYPAMADHKASVSLDDETNIPDVEVFLSADGVHGNMVSEPVMKYFETNGISRCVIELDDGRKGSFGVIGPGEETAQLLIRISGALE
jgi:hypothetical protein